MRIEDRGKPILYFLIVTVFVGFLTKISSQAAENTSEQTILQGKSRCVLVPHKTQKIKTSHGSIGKITEAPKLFFYDKEGKKIKAIEPEQTSTKIIVAKDESHAVVMTPFHLGQDAPQKDTSKIEYYNSQGNLLWKKESKWPTVSENKKDFVHMWEGVAAISSNGQVVGIRESERNPHEYPSEINKERLIFIDTKGGEIWRLEVPPYTQRATLAPNGQYGFIDGGNKYIFFSLSKKVSKIVNNDRKRIKPGVIEWLKNADISDSGHIHIHKVQTEQDKENKVGEVELELD